MLRGVPRRQDRGALVRPKNVDLADRTVRSRNHAFQQAGQARHKQLNGRAIEQVRLEVEPQLQPCPRNDEQAKG